jgi:hypothetical protein
MAETRKGRVTLADLLSVLNEDENLVITHHMGANLYEAVGVGTAAELRAARCVEVCGDNIVEHLAAEVDDWPDTAGPAALVVTIGGKAAEV